MHVLHPRDAVLPQLEFPLLPHGPGRLDHCLFGNQQVPGQSHHESMSLHGAAYASESVRRGKEGFGGLPITRQFFGRMRLP